MNPKERLLTVLNGGIPDKVPHFELLFQLEKEVTGKKWASFSMWQSASEKERDRYFHEFFEIWEELLDAYPLSAIPIPTQLGGHYSGKVYPEAIRRFGHRVLLFDFNGNGTFWMPTGSEIMDFSVRLYEDMDGLHEEAVKRKEDAIRLAKIQADAGADFIVINSDFAFNEGPFISPAKFSEIVTPYLTEIVDAMHNLGLKAILHSDGDLRLILDQLVSAGIDGYQSVDPQGHMDIAEVKRAYGGKLILMGNVQASYLQDDNEDRIRESARYCLTHGKPGGGYIFSTSNCIFDGMPLHNYHVMLEEYEKHSLY